MKKKNVINIPFLIFLLAYSVGIFYMIYHQATGTFYSDMPAYLLEIQGLDSGYSFPYPLFFKTAWLLSLCMPIEVAVPIVLSALNILGIVALERYVAKEYENLSSCRRIAAVTLAVFAVYLVSMVYWPLTPVMDLPEGAQWGSRYLGVFSPNPYQNATYIATRPFAILLILQYVKIYENLSDCKTKDFIWLAVYMLLSTLAKPSFVFIFLPVMAFLTIVIGVKNKFKIAKNQLLLVATVIPTVIALGFQYLAVFGEDSGGGIKLGFATCWHLWTPYIKQAFVKANLFPIIYLVFHLKELKKDKLLSISWLVYLVGFGSFVLLYEDGYRIYDANFAWGYMHGMFAVFMASIIPMFKRLCSKEKEYRWQDIISTVFLVPHIVCGVIFYLYMITGHSASLF